MQKDATFSPDRVHRYTLSRQWNGMQPVCGFIMLNPSTADENYLDPTLTRCLNYAGQWGYGTMLVANIFAFRSTGPEGLLSCDDPIGPDNDRAIMEVVRGSNLVICGWGNTSSVKRLIYPRSEKVLSIIKGIGAKAYALRINKDGTPGHPLYLKATLKPIPYKED